ncbi:MAG: hypothetical protein ACK4NA_12870 [Alphaproteobacteria bacterium]
MTVLLAWVNRIDDAATVLTASQQAGDLAIQNVADPIVGRRWRTTSLTAYGQADFGADREIGVVALVFPRDTTFPLMGTITHAFDADGGTPGAGALLSETVAIGTAEGYGYHVVTLDAPVSARYWRWTFAVSGVDWIDVGRAWAGPAWRPSVNISLGWGQQWDDLSRISQSPRSGAEFVDPGPRQRAMAFGLDFMSEEDKDDMREMERLAGLSSQCLFVQNPAAPARETVLGRLAETSPIREPGLSIYSKAFRIRESL